MNFYTLFLFLSLVALSASVLSVFASISFVFERRHRSAAVVGFGCAALFLLGAHLHPDFGGDVIDHCLPQHSMASSSWAGNDGRGSSSLARFCGYMAGGVDNLPGGELKNSVLPHADFL